VSAPHRVVVTGCGVIAPVGLDVPAYWASLKEGRSGIGEPTSVPPELLQKEVVAEVRDFDPGKHFTERELPALDRVSQFAVVAAREALAQSGLRVEGEQADRTASIIGTGIGGSLTIDDSYKRLYRDNATRVYPLTVPKLMPNAPASQVSMQLGIRGPSFGVVSACSSATHAIGLAFQMVRAGIADAALTGGTEACITLGTLKGWEALRVQATDTCRPFSKDRKGLVIGEGAGMLVLESLDHALARGARIHAEIVGFGSNSDGDHPTHPNSETMEVAMRLALQDAGLAPEAIGYVNAHATATEQGDIAESQAMNRLFGSRVPVSSAKGHLGHTLGACGAIESWFTIQMMRGGWFMPTLNLRNVDSRCGELDYIVNGGRQLDTEFAMKNNFAFGGVNTSLIYRRWRD
jgi:nodulation protein E